MTMSNTADPPAGREGMAREEWEARVDLAALYRITALLGLDDLIYTHISARVPGPAEHFLINPFGLLYEEVTASNLVKVDLDGNIVGPADHPINPAGFVIHSCVHRARPDVTCVMHTHTVAGTGVSAQAEGLLPITQDALLFHGDIAYHDYEGLALDLDEQKRLVADLGDRQLMILRNHGLLTCGRTTAEAFVLMYYLEQACQMQIAAQAGGRLHVPGEEAKVRVRGQARAAFGGQGVGRLEFAAMKRKLDRLDPSYKT
jgi:ribulose-5-phosphate 4-epimerase/fuculose-1-phosphate aldolase